MTTALSIPAFSSPAGFAEAASEGQWKRCAWLDWLNREVMNWMFDPDGEEVCVLEAPVRHGKSLYCSKWLPAWFIGMNPDKNVMLVSYAADVAERWGEQTRDIIAAWGPKFFGIGVCKDKASKSQWSVYDVETGRPTGGEVYARGHGGALTGLGASLIVPDDLIKGPEEANSPAHRAKLWELINSGLFTRRNPGCKTLLPMARWNQDDPVGRILKLREAGLMTVKVIRLPAICETQAERDRSHRDHGLPAGLPDPLGREPGQAMWPERYNEKALAAVKKRDPSSYNSLYQQNPVPREGGMFQPHYFYGADGQSHILDRHYWQAKQGFKVVERKCGWDTAASDSAGCHTVGVLMAKTVAGFCVIEKVWRGQWSPGERNHRIRQIAESNSHLDPAPENVVEQEPGGGGKEAAKAIVTYMAGIPFRRDRVHETKDVRAQPFSTFAHEENVYIVAGEVPREYVERVCQFPNGADRDETDASTLTFNHLFDINGGRAWDIDKVSEEFQRPVLGEDDEPKDDFASQWSAAMRNLN